MLKGFIIFLTATDAPVSWSFAELITWSDGVNGGTMRKKRKDVRRSGLDPPLRHSMRRRNRRNDAMRGVSTSTISSAVNEESNARRREN